MSTPSLARVTLLMPKRLTLGVAVANLAGNQTIKMAFPQFAELWKLIDLLVRKDFRQANLVVGKLGWGTPRQCRLSQDEQITHISLWSLLSAPLIIGCDLMEIDDFTLRLLCNDEVIAINQDTLGKQAYCVRDLRLTDTDGNLRRHETVYVKRLCNGSFAVGIFNRGPAPAEIQLNWSDIGISGRHNVRNAWGRQDIGVFDESFEVGVPAHGAQLLLINGNLI